MNVVRRIVVDDRERTVIRKLSQYDIPYERYRLLIGDYYLYDTDNVIRYVIERKTLTDLSNSIKTKRIYHQESKLRRFIELNNTAKIIFVLEGTDSSYISKCKNPTFHLLPFETITKWIYNRSGVDNIVIHRTIDIDDTIKLLQTL